MRHIACHTLLALPGVLSAQFCDSLEITSVQYAPFGGGLHVLLHNASTELLSVPTFDAYDANGDTLVLGAFNFFGIGPGVTQLHQLPLVAGASEAASPFTGTLLLHYQDEVDDQTCLYPFIAIDLCPAPQPCIPLLVYAYQQGGLVETDLDWSVSDADNIVQADGVLHMDGTGFGYATAELCLPPGAYSMHMEQDVPAGNILQVGMTQAGFAYSDGTNTQLPVGGSVDHAFGFYASCIDDEQTINEPGAEAPTVFIEGRVLWITSLDGSALGPMIILDDMGRTVRSIRANADRIAADLSALAPGAYLVRSIGPEISWAAQRFILH